MTSINVGDVIGDCSACDAKQSVFYRGDNEAVCKTCHIMFTVDFEDEHSSAPAPSKPEPMEPLTLQLTEPKVPDVRPPRPQPPKVDELDKLNLPEYIKNSRPWRWAHEYKNTGNPYRPETKSFTVFDTIARNNGINLIGILNELASFMNMKPNSLLTVYEVVTQCVAAGLIVVDDTTGKFTVCQGAPKPAPLP